MEPTQQHYFNLVSKSSMEGSGAPIALIRESTRSGPERGVCHSAVLLHPSACSHKGRDSCFSTHDV